MRALLLVWLAIFVMPLVGAQQVRIRFWIRTVSFWSAWPTVMRWAG